jgi:hypothetical protein
MDQDPFTGIPFVDFSTAQALGLSWQASFDLGVVQGQGGRRRGWLNLNKTNFRKAKPGMTVLIFTPGADTMLATLVSTQGDRQGWVTFKASNGQTYKTRGWNLWAIKL